VDAGIILPPGVKPWMSRIAVATDTSCVIARKLICFQPFRLTVLRIASWNFAGHTMRSLMRS
jgi:hypothetical protein